MLWCIRVTAASCLYTVLPFAECIFVCWGRVVANLLICLLQDMKIALWFIWEAGRLHYCENLISTGASEDVNIVTVSSTLETVCIVIHLEIRWKVDDHAKTWESMFWYLPLHRTQVCWYFLTHLHECLVTVVLGLLFFLLFSWPAALW